MRHLAYAETFVGIEVSRDHLLLDAHPRPHPSRHPNSSHGCVALQDDLARLAPRLVVVGAAHGAEQQLLESLAMGPWCVAVIDAPAARRFAEAIGVLIEGGRADARVLARYAHAIRPENQRNQACIIFESLLLRKIYLGWSG